MNLTNNIHVMTNQVAMVLQETGFYWLQDELFLFSVCHNLNVWNAFSVRTALFVYSFYIYIGVQSLPLKVFETNQIYVLFYSCLALFKHLCVSFIFAITSLVGVLSPNRSHHSYRYSGHYHGQRIHCGYYKIIKLQYVLLVPTGPWNQGNETFYK